MPSKPILSEFDKGNIKKRLQSLCEQFWITWGYKKTSVKELCGNAEIAIGTFYSIYPTKEELFFETAKIVQFRLTEQFLQVIQKNPNKTGFAKALKVLCHEFDSNTFLRNVSTLDFQSMEEIKFDTMKFFRKSIQIADLQLQIDESKAYGIFSALLATINAKQTLATVYDYFEILYFMVDHLIADIFE